MKRIECPNCGPLEVNNFSYNQCPKCGADATQLCSVCCKNGYYRAYSVIFAEDYKEYHRGERIDSICKYCFGELSRVCKIINPHAKSLGDYIGDCNENSR